MYMYLVSTNPISTLCANSVVARPAVWYAGGRWFDSSCYAYAIFLFYRVCTGTYQYVPVHTGMYRYIQVYPCIYQYVTVHTCIDSVHHSTNQVQASMYSILTRITQYAPLPLAKRYQSPWANTMYINLVWTFYITNICTLVAQWHDMPHTMHEVIGSNPTVMHMINFCFSANLPVHTGIYTVRHSTYLS